MKHQPRGRPQPLPGQLGHPFHAPVPGGGVHVHRQDRDFAVAWAKMYGKGRVFYSTFGHTDESWDDPRVQTMYLEAIKWAIGGGESELDAGDGHAAPGRHNWRHVRRAGEAPHRAPRSSRSGLLNDLILTTHGTPGRTRTSSPSAPSPPTTR